MSRIDEALQRARGTGSSTPEGDVEAAAPWDFGDVSIEPVQPAVAPPQVPTAEAAPATGDAAPATAPTEFTGTLPESGLFGPLDGDEKIVGAGLAPAVLEEYRKLAASLHQAQLERGLKVVLIASAMPGEGKTLTAANIALTLTSSYSRRVLLVDADLRRPSQHALFRVPVTTGLSEGLSGNATSRVSAIQLSPLLALLPAGRPVADPVPLLTSERMIELLRDARQHFDWIIIDTPPVGLLTDANLLTKGSDAALLVIHANRTPFALVQKAVQALGKAKIFGVVMNRLEDQPSMTGSGSYSGYSGYYGNYLRSGK